MSDTFHIPPGPGSGFKSVTAFRLSSVLFHKVVRSDLFSKLVNKNACMNFPLMFKRGNSMTRQHRVTPQSFRFQRNFGIREPLIQFFKIPQKILPPTIFSPSGGNRILQFLRNSQKQAFFKKSSLPHFLSDKK